MPIVKPRAGQAFTITDAPEWPNVLFQTDAPGPHQWEWTLVWSHFRKSGVVSQAGNSWDAIDVIRDRGGQLTVKVTANKKSLGSVTVTIKGTNPSESAVRTYLQGKPGTDGFFEIINHESHTQHFSTHGTPKLSFDRGIGICQLTNPAPTFEQSWNWQNNIDAGVNLFSQKRASALAYLSQSNRTYTADQLKRETICRWNGGHYHSWDDKKGEWIRRPTILCDSKTGNIGWDMTDSDNKGKTEEELHKRDAGTYNDPKNRSGWDYYGVCYADAILR